MCGIAGAFVFEGGDFRITERYIIEMRETMSHRGPDGSGVWISPDGRIGLGHRRLSIIDTSDAALQPMCNEDGSLWIVFNGEIYNHAEIRKELETAGGHTWKTDHSDTEVILHAFEQWGIECLERFIGMFAIALYDTRKRELWLVRDRVGIKPLYYSVHNGRIVFASEIKALLKDRDQKRAVDEEALYHYLTFLTTPAPMTLFEGIGKLRGGTWLRIRGNGDIYEHRYWDVLDNTRPVSDMTEADIKDRILGSLRSSVKYRKISDVPVGIFLSGGVDSSTNAALFAEGESGTVKTFSVGYSREYDSYTNEFDYARRMAGEIKAEHHERQLTIDDFLELLSLMVYHQDEPIADPVCFPIYYVSKLARDNGVTVCQLGEGADELFCGYPLWMTKLKLQRYSNLPLAGLFKKPLMAGLHVLGKDDTNYYEWLRRGANGTPVFWGGSEALNEARKKKVISERLRNKFRNYTSWEALKPIYRRYEEKAPVKSTLNWMTYLDLNLRLPELLLMRVDKMSMAVSLECRVPFLDHRFVELAMGIPEALKVKNNSPKYILKESVRGLVPDYIIDREKQGFGVPIHEWFSDKLGNVAREELDSFCRKTDFFDPSEVADMMRKGKGWHVWFLLNFVLWWKKFID